MGHVKLGDKVQDVVTGFQGTVVATTAYLYGDTRVAVQGALAADGKLPDWAWLDEAQVRLLEANK